MRWFQLVTVLVTLTSLGRALSAKEEGGGGGGVTGSKKEGKVFSLFNIVQFVNTGCRSQSTLTNSGTTSPYRNGTCYTSSQCTTLGGTASGNCASGFGVCCVFLVTTSGSTISQNCTYLRNPGFPTAFTGSTAAVTYTVQKCTSSVCYLRLDFESFTILGTGNTVETLGGVCQDTFKVTTNTKQLTPTICGQNAGQHMYIDMGNAATDTATLTFAFLSTDTTSSRTYEIKVTQIPCIGNNAYVPPAGCLQNNIGLTGRFTTFNFIPTNDNHLASQDYQICIRQEAGYCCIQYAPCADQTNAWSLDEASPTLAGVDSLCSGDYVEISTSNAICNQGPQLTPVVNKYCGGIFSATSAATLNGVVCDCTQPFEVSIHTDTTAEQAAVKNRGVCLTWTQIPCNS